MTAVAQTKKAVRFRFTGLVANKDPEGYYQTRWDAATPVSVLAVDLPEAVGKVKALMGSTGCYRVWTIRWSSIEEEQEPSL